MNDNKKNIVEGAIACLIAVATIAALITSSFVFGHEHNTSELVFAIVNVAAPLIAGVLAAKQSFKK